MHNRYGVREQRTTADDIDLHVESIQTLGYTILPSGFTSDQMAEWRQKLDTLHARQTEAGGGEEELAKLGEADTVRALFAYDEAFLTVFQNEGVLEICRRLLGSHFILMLQNGIVNRPLKGAPHHQTAYHRDLPYQHWVSTRPLSLNALFCLDDFSQETGGTIILPTTHKQEHFPSEGYISRNEQVVTAPAGSFIVFDSMLYHRAGLNRSQNVRRAVNQVYTLPFLKQQIVLPALLKGKWKDDPFLGPLLGYESDPPSSVEEWLERRRQKIGPKAPA